MAKSFRTSLSRKVINRIQTDSLKQCILTRAKIPRSLMVRFYVALHETNGSRIVLPSQTVNPKGFGLYLTPINSIVSSIFQNKNKHLTGKRNKGTFIERFDELHFLRKKFHFKSKLDRKGFSGSERQKLKQYIQQYDPLVIPHDNMEKVAQRLLRDEVKALLKVGFAAGEILIEPLEIESHLQPMGGDNMMGSCSLQPCSSTLLIYSDDARYIFGQDAVVPDKNFQLVVSDSCPSAFQLICSCLRLCYMNDIWHDDIYPQAFLHSFSRSSKTSINGF